MWSAHFSDTVGGPRLLTLVRGLLFAVLVGCVGFVWTAPDSAAAGPNVDGYVYDADGDVAVDGATLHGTFETLARAGTSGFVAPGPHLRLPSDLVAPRPTLSGRTVLGGNWDEAIRAARRAKPLDGFHDVVAHGTPTGIYDDVGNLLSPSEAASVIRSTPSWGGQDIRLLSCSAGCPTGNFAQGLADKLGVAVRAPTVDFYVNSRGVPVLDSGGQWLTYLPGGG